jgi:PEP-CTERM motif
MNVFSGKSLAALALVAGLGLSTAAQATSITWTDWSASATNTGSGTGTTSVTGSMGGITVTYNGQLNAVNNFVNWAPDATYNGGLPGNAPPNSFDSITEGINGGPSYTETFTFSSAVTDPYMAMWSLGNSNQQISLDFSDPFTIVSCGPSAQYQGGCITKVSDNILAAEGDGTIQFSGTYTSISFTVPVSEFYYGLTIGAPNPAIAPTPEPSSLALLGTGLLGVVAAGRRKLFKA